MRSITDDILQWSEYYLEPKNKHLGDVPVCPYAKKARLQNKYRILECKNFSNFQDTIIEGAELAKDPDIQIVIVGCSDIGYEPEELNSVIDILNRVLVPQDIYLMGAHPWDDDEEESNLAMAALPGDSTCGSRASIEEGVPCLPSGEVLSGPVSPSAEYECSL